MSSNGFDLVHLCTILLCVLEEQMWWMQTQPHMCYFWSTFASSRTPGGSGRTVVICAPIHSLSTLISILIWPGQYIHLHKMNACFIWESCL